MHNWISPDWPAPDRVRALATTRHGGVSVGPYAALNLGSHVGDDPQAVAANRAIVREVLPSEPVWLNQVHGIAVVRAENAAINATADAAYSRQPGTVCAIMTADCLPLLLCDRAGTVVGAAHCGWRSLDGGVIEALLSEMALPGEQCLAWLGPAIGPQAFEVGDEVPQTFMDFDPAAAVAFQARPGIPGKWWADLYVLARLRLAALGVSAVSGGNFCTHSDPSRFFSYRRDGVTGRMATLIWLAA